MYIKKILGLDISSTTIGYSVVKSNKTGYKLLKKGYYKPLKDCSLFESLLETKKFILDLVEENKPDDIAIEDITEFIQGKSTSKTIIKLTTYNRMIGLTIYEKLGIEPTLLNVNTIRSVIKPKGYKGRLSKEDVPEVVAKILNEDFEYIYNKKGAIAVESYDIADAIAVSLAHIALEKAKL